MPRDALTWPAIQRVLDDCPVVDEYQGYYRQFAAVHRRVNALVPSTRDLLRNAMRPDMRVLDIGCGYGQTLLDLASLFRTGHGIDESADEMIARAVTEQARRGIGNVDFQQAKAAALPFADGTFDLVFSERGPMGYQDETLREALRVLVPGGLVVLELVGEWNSWETRAAFEPDYRRPPSPLGRLEVERDRLERHGVSVRTAASRIESLEFDGVQDWARYQIYSWSAPGRDALRHENMDAIRRLAEIAATPTGGIGITVHTLLLTGRRA